MDNLPKFKILIEDDNDVNILLNYIIINNRQIKTKSKNKIKK